MALQITSLGSLPSPASTVPNAFPYTKLWCAQQVDTLDSVIHVDLSSLSRSWSKQEDMMVFCYALASHLVQTCSREAVHSPGSLCICRSGTVLASVFLWLELCPPSQGRGHGPRWLLCLYADHHSGETTHAVSPLLLSSSSLLRKKIQCFSVSPSTWICFS